MVRIEASRVLGIDDKAAWNFVDMCRARMTRQYKHNMTIVRELEKAHYGINSYFHLVEQGLFQEPQFEGDYSYHPDAVPNDNIVEAPNTAVNNEGDIDTNADLEEMELEIQGVSYNEAETEKDVVDKVQNVGKAIVPFLPISISE